jgi:hypothetical protein
MENGKAVLKDNLRVFVVPTEILDMDIAANEKLVYMVLRSYANGQNGIVFPSYATIAKKASISRTTAIKCVKSLEEAGLLVKETRLKVSTNGKASQTSNEYTLIRPAELGSAGNVPPASEVGKQTDHPSQTTTPPPVQEMNQGSANAEPEKESLKGLGLKESFKKERDIKTINSARVDSDLKDFLLGKVETFEEREIDVEIVTTWLEDNEGLYSYTQFAVGIHQLLSYPEKIEKPVRFLNSTFAHIDKHVENFRNAQKAKAEKEAREKKSAKSEEPVQITRPVPFYNWLEN